VDNNNTLELGKVCFICGGKNHIARNCPSKALRSKYRKERRQKMFDSISSISSNNNNIKKKEKNYRVFLSESHENVKEIYIKINKLGCISNGLANTIYHQIHSIFYLKCFYELNVSDKLIFKNDYASKVIKDKIRKLCYDYDNKNGLDSTCYNSFEEVENIKGKIYNEINEYRDKVRIDVIKEYYKDCIKEEMEEYAKDYCNNKDIELEGKIGQQVMIDRLVDTMVKEKKDMIKGLQKMLLSKVIPDNRIKKNLLPDGKSNNMRNEKNKKGYKKENKKEEKKYPRVVVDVSKYNVPYNYDVGMTSCDNSKLTANKEFKEGNSVSISVKPKKKGFLSRLFG